MSGVPKLIKKLSFSQTEQNDRGTMGSAFSPRGTFANMLETAFTPRAVTEKIAAVTIQTYFRAFRSRLAVRKMKQRAIIYRMALRQEHRAAILVQSRWVAHVRFKAIVKIQARQRGKLAKGKVDGLKTDQVEANKIKKSKVVALVKERVCGTVQKQGKALGIGSKKIRVWGTRYISITDDYPISHASLQWHIPSNGDQSPATPRKGSKAPSSLLLKEIQSCSFASENMIVIFSHQRKYLFAFSTIEQTNLMKAGIELLVNVAINGDAKNADPALMEKAMQKMSIDLTFWTPEADEGGFDHQSDVDKAKADAGFMVSECGVYGSA